LLDSLLQEISFRFEFLKMSLKIISEIKKEDDMVFFCHPVPARGSHHMDINDNPFQAKDESEQNIDVVDTRSSDISAGPVELLSDLEIDRGGLSEDIKDDLFAGFQEQFYPIISFQEELEIMQEIFSRPEKNWDHLGGLLEMEPLRVVPQSWSDEMLDPVTRRCDLMMPNTCVATTSVRPTCPITISSVDEGKHYSRFIISKNGFNSPADLEEGGSSTNRPWGSLRARTKKTFRTQADLKRLKENTQPLNQIRLEKSVNVHNRTFLKCLPSKAQMNVGSEDKLPDIPLGFKEPRVTPKKKDWSQSSPDRPKSPKYEMSPMTRQRYLSRDNPKSKDKVIKVLNFREVEVGSGKLKKKEHNSAERLRRIQQRESFRELSRLLPGYQEGPVLSKISVLTEALSYCSQLEKESARLESVREKMRKRNCALTVAKDLLLKETSK